MQQLEQPRVESVPRPLLRTCLVEGQPDDKAADLAQKPSRATYRVFLALTLLSYGAVFSSVLIQTNGFPYVTDNNESFSSLWHAHNLYSFDFFQSWGLTDESFSKSPEAHPYVHTHQGNFPRLYAYLIYVLGARSINAQIVVTTFTIGLLSIFLAYHLISKLANPALAFFVTLFLMTDYVFFVQWQVVTYRVWHGFFIFSSLLCVAYCDGGGKTWRILTFLNFLALFYFEAAFVIFVTTTCIAFAVYSCWGKWRAFRRLAYTAAAGAITGLAILLIQLVGYMGAENVAKDVYYTIKARQYTDPWATEAEMMEFYRSRNIAFFDNFTRGTHFLKPINFLRISAYYHLSPYTPFVVVPAFLLVGAAALRGFFNWRDARRQAAAGLAAGGLAAGSPSLFLRTVSVVGAAFLFLSAAVWTYVLSYTLLPIVWPAFYLDVDLFAMRDLPLITLGATGLCFYTARKFFGVADRTHGFARDLSGGVLFLAAAFMFWTLRDNFAPVYHEALNARALQFLACLGVLGLLTLGLALARFCGGTKGTAEKPLSISLAMLWMSGVAGYVAASSLLGGYVLSGYLSRWLSFFSFFVNPFLGVAVYCVCRLIWQEGARLLAREQATSSATPTPRGYLGISVRAWVLVNSLAFLCLIWARLQLVFVEYLPPDHFTGLQTLADAECQGKTVICNTYAAPAAWLMGKWGYCDRRFFPDRIASRREGVVQEGNKFAYMWLADEKTNAAYRKPEYFLFMWHQSVDMVTERIIDRHLGRTIDPMKTIRDATRFHHPSPAHPELVGYELDPYPRWALIKLNWDEPTARRR